MVKLRELKLDFSKLSNGIDDFLFQKQLNIKKTIFLFFQYKNIEITSINQINNYIGDNFSIFAQFVDTAIKNGTLKGTPKKLNTYYKEQKERYELVKDEFKNLDLSKDEKWILGLSKRYCFNAVQSFFNKNGFDLPKKDFSFTSKQLQFYPYILELRNHNLIQECIIYSKKYLNEN